MTREWKPGDVGITGERVPDESQVRFMVSGDDEDGLRFHYADGVRLNFPPRDDARPLVVIDPEDREQVEQVISEYVHAFAARRPDVASGAWGEAHADSMQAALREFANPTLPKPEEPTGLGAVVEDSNGDRWVRLAARIADFDWLHADDPNRSRAWRNIAAVRVLSDGVTP